VGTVPHDLSPEAKGLKLALVLWSGPLGGAETLTAMLAREWREWGIDASVVFVTHGVPLAERLDRDGVPHLSVGLSRGRAGLVHPRRLARNVSAAGPDGALLTDSGYLAAALRAGGYRGRIVGVEHGKLLAAHTLSPARRLRNRLEASVGARFRAVDVGVSDFMVQEIRRHPHARRVCRIHNGIDNRLFAPAGNGDGSGSGSILIGSAARLIPGKGIEHLVRAVAQLRDLKVRVEIAGDGPERQSLARLAEELEVDDVVSLRGPIQMMPEFWRRCDLAVVPADSLLESFSMVTLEAMACGVPVVTTRNGGIPEVLADGESGRIVPPGDPGALATAIRAYATDPDLRRRHAAAARERACRYFGIEATAAQYLGLFAPRQAR
jgi:glycosyltransferase involved in cell wall biosynthesis